MIRALLVVIVALLGLLGLQTWRIDHLQLGIEQARADAALAQVAGIEQARETEAEWADKLRRAQHARESETVRAQRVADGLRADRDRLRDDIAAYAAGPAADSVAACGDRAATLGRLLDDALRTAAACAAGAEQHATDLRTVLAGWPRPAPRNDEAPTP